MRLNFDKCNKVGTMKHNVPNGGVAVLDGNNRLVAYRRDPVGKGWDWIKKSFQFIGKKGK